MIKLNCLIQDDNRSDPEGMEVHILRLSKKELKDLIDRCQYKTMYEHVSNQYCEPTWERFNKQQKRESVYSDNKERLATANRVLKRIEKNRLDRIS